MRLFLFSFLCVALLSACGQKGALYLPDDAKPKPPTMNPATPVPASSTTPSVSAPSPAPAH